MPVARPAGGTDRQCRLNFHDQRMLNGSSPRRLPDLRLIAHRLLLGITLAAMNVLILRYWHLERDLPGA